MQIVFFTQLPNESNSIILNGGTLYFNGNDFPSSCRYYTENYTALADCDTLYLPMHPSLEDVCTAYLADAVSKSQKLPRAASMLCEFLSSLPKREIPFDRSSLDTLPVIFKYLLSTVRDEKDATKMLDIIFSILRQFMMDMLLFEDLDLATAPISAKIPAAQPVKTDAEQELNAYISDCQKGSEHDLVLPMQNGTLQSRRVLCLANPTCSCPDLFASLCGFSALIISYDDTADFYPLDCCFDAVSSLIKANGSFIQACNHQIKSSADSLALLSLFNDLSCKSCKLVYTAIVSAKARVIKKLQPQYSYNGLIFNAKAVEQNGKNYVVLEHYPETSGLHFYHAMQLAQQLRTDMLNMDLATVIGAEITVKDKYCDLLIDIPVDCMQDFHAVSIKCEGGDFALLDDGVISIWDKEPPLDAMRNILQDISRMELEVLKNPLNAISLLQEATLIKISINSGKGFIKEALIGCKADKRAEALCVSAQDSARVILLRRAAVLTIGVSAVISLLLCAFPFVCGFIKPEKEYLIPAIACAIILFILILIAFLTVRKKRIGKKEKQADKDK